MIKELGVIAILFLLLVAVICGGLWLAWWSIGQFFSGSQHWAAFWLLLMLIPTTSSRKKD